MSSLSYYFYTTMQNTEKVVDSHGLRRGLQSIAAFAAGNWKMVQFALATALL